MKTKGHDRTAIRAILVGTVGALALSMLFFRLAHSPQVHVIEIGGVGVPALADFEDPPPPPEVAPRMTNGSKVSRAVAFAYPSLLRDAGIGGSVEVWVLVDEEGVVQNTRLPESSGHAQLDVAALAAAGIVEFTPAMHAGKNVSVWISLPITFQVR